MSDKTISPVTPVAVTQQVISAAAVSVALEAAVAHAERIGVRINVAVADSGGNLAGFLRMPGAFLQSIDIAIDKAYTASGFGFSTKDWMKHIGHDEGMKLGFSARPRLVVFGGGLPLYRPDQRLHAHEQARHDASRRRRDRLEESARRRQAQHLRSRCRRNPRLLHHHAVHGH